MVATYAITLNSMVAKSQPWRRRRRRKSFSSTFPKMGPWIPGRGEKLWQGHSSALAGEQKKSERSRHTKLSREINPPHSHSNRKSVSGRRQHCDSSKQKDSGRHRHHHPATAIIITLIASSTQRDEFQQHLSK